VRNRRHWETLFQIAAHPPRVDRLDRLLHVALRLPTGVILQLVEVGDVKELISWPGPLQCVIRAFAGEFLNFIDHFQQRNGILHPAANVVDLTRCLVDLLAHLIKCQHKIMHAQDVANLAAIAVNGNSPVFKS